MSDANRKKGSVMTLQEMEMEFDSEWILVGDPQTNESLEVVRGTVLCHSKDRDEVYRAAVRLRPKRSAILYTGKMPPDTAIALCGQQLSIDFREGARPSRCWSAD